VLLNEDRFLLSPLAGLLQKVGKGSEVGIEAGFG
jgi:hypothetical protein